MLSRLKFVNLVFFLFVSIVLANASIANQQVTDYDSEISIAYDDWDDLLGKTVLVTGRSDRFYPPKLKPGIASRVVLGNKSNTRLEANRLFYHLFTDETLSYVTNLRQSLEMVPDEIPLSKLHPDERLAYWLNLRNVAVVEAIAHRYNISKLRKFMRKTLSEPRLTVGGKMLSIADIEAHIIKEWRNPLVIYGFYNGAIGGPNIRKRAFTRENVWEALEDNAREFTVSLRGVIFDRRGRAQVSEHYYNYSELFPDFDNDLKRHMQKYTSTLIASKLATIERIRPARYDWYIADLIGGTRLTLNTASTNFIPQTLTQSIGSQAFVFERQLAVFPPQAREFIRGVRARNIRRGKLPGTVEVEEVPKNAGGTD